VGSHSTPVWVGLLPLGLNAAGLKRNFYHDDHYVAVLRACTTVSGSSEENAEAYQVAHTALTQYLETTNVPNENIMLLYLQACNALLAADEARDSAIVDAMRNCPAGTFESAAVRNALFKVISRYTYE
jgi:hypothetical protein